jgi:hypothetical protein
MGVFTEEEKRAILAEFPEPPRKRPKPQEIVAGVTQETAKRAQANPDRVRVTVLSTPEEPVAKTERPWRVEVRTVDDGPRANEPPELFERRPRSDAEPIEVDEFGRPSRVRVIDHATNTTGVVDFFGGIRPVNNVLTDWDPRSGLHRDDD